MTITFKAARGHIVFRFLFFVFLVEEQAIAIYNETGRFQQAGKMLKEIGEIHEKNRDYLAAVDALQRAAEYLQVIKAAVGARDVDSKCPRGR